MTRQHRIVKVVAIAALMAMVAVACGGGSDEGAAGSEAPVQPGVSFDGEDGGVAVATTAPIPLVTEDEATPVPATPDASNVLVDGEDP